MVLKLGLNIFFFLITGREEKTVTVYFRKIALNMFLLTLCFFMELK